MNRSAKEGDAQSRQRRTKKTASEEAGEQESETKQEKRETGDFVEILEEKILKNMKKLSEIDLPKVNFGALFSGVDKVYKSIRDYDTVISSQANGVSTKLVEYVKKSIADYKNKK